MKFFHYAAQAIVVLGFFLLGLVSYMIWWPIATSVYEQERFMVNPLEVRAGGVINIHLIYDKYTDATAHITVSFVDGTLIESFSYMSNKPRGHYDHWRRIPVPRTLLPGRYYLLLEVKYPINKLRTETVTTRSIYFDLVE